MSEVTPPPPANREDIEVQEVTPSRPAYLDHPAELPRESRIGEAPMRGPSTAPTGEVGPLPSGGSLSVPTTPNTPYYYIKAPTGQTIYFTSESLAQAYQTSLSNPVSGAGPFTKGVYGGPKSGYYTASELNQGTKAVDNLVEAITSGVGYGGFFFGLPFREGYSLATTGKVKGFSLPSESEASAAGSFGLEAGAIALGGEAVGAAIAGFELGTAATAGIYALYGGGSNAVFSVLQGARNPLQIGESAAFGAALGAGFGGLAGIFGKVGGAAEAGAAERQLNDLGLTTIGTETTGESVSPVFATIEQANDLGVDTGPSITQRFAMTITGTKPTITNVPVAGGTFTESGLEVEPPVNVFSFPGPASYYEQGVGGVIGGQYASSGFDIADIEGPNPVKGLGAFENEPPQPPIEPSTAFQEPAEQGSEGLGQSTNQPYTDIQSKTFGKLGIGGGTRDFGGYLPGAGGRPTEEYATIVRYPPASTPPIIRSLQYGDLLSSFSSGSRTASGFNLPGYALGNLYNQPGLKANISPVTDAILGTGVTPGISTSPSTGQSLIITPGTITGPTTGQSTTPGLSTATTPATVTIPTLTTPNYPPLEPGFTPGATPPGIPLVALTNFPSGGSEGKKSKKKFAFGERRNPVNVTFGGGINVGKAYSLTPPKKRRR